LGKVIGTKWKKFWEKEKTVRETIKNEMAPLKSVVTFSSFSFLLFQSNNHFAFFLANPM
jgi:hypothetical protein